MILQDTFVLSAQTESTSTHVQIIFRDMYEYITWTKTKTTPSSETCFHSAPRDQAEAADVEAEPHDLSLPLLCIKTLLLVSKEQHLFLAGNQLP